MGGFFVIWLLMMIGVVVGWIVFLVAVWRGMVAHESIAQSLKLIAGKTDLTDRSTSG
jgi:uncharacterized membrane protein